MKVLISGAGVAGPTLAYFMAHHGHEVVMVERSRAFRDGGYVIDFWGHGMHVAEHMGLKQRVLDEGFVVEELTLVDANGHREGGFPFAPMIEAMPQGFRSLPRGRLARMVFEKAMEESHVEVKFDLTITEIEQHDGSGGEKKGVTATLSNGEKIWADVLVGADGLHSNVRKLAFPPVSECLVKHETASTSSKHLCGEPLAYMGFKVAAATVTGFASSMSAYESYAEPGRSVSWFALGEDHALLLFVFVDEENVAVPDDLEGKRALLTAMFDGMGGRGPEALEKALAEENLYVDSVSQSRLSSWHQGRVVLIGDAAACPSLLAGEGTALGMLEAYVLAGELHRAGEEGIDSAVEQYEDLLQQYVLKKQDDAVGFAGVFAPKTWVGLKFRNYCSRLLSIGFIQRWTLGSMLSTLLEVPDYFAEAAPAAEEASGESA